MPIPGPSDATSKDMPIQPHHIGPRTKHTERRKSTQEILAVHLINSSPTRALKTAITLEEKAWTDKKSYLGYLKECGATAIMVQPEQKRVSMGYAEDTKVYGV